VRPVDVTPLLLESERHNPTVAELKRWRSKGLRLTADDEGRLDMDEAWRWEDGRLVVANGWAL